LHQAAHPAQHLQEIDFSAGCSDLPA